MRVVRLDRTSSAALDLDLVRGLAALVVLVGHLRNLFFVPFSELENPGWGTKALYFLTGYGHQAVIVFFVLSGFLVGSGVVAQVQAGKWSWKQYAINRGSRLGIVLFPALLLGFGVDWAGLLAFGEHGVYGGGARFNGIVPVPVEDRLGWLTLVGNGAFLQTIFVPTLGSNGALWSLANEFWYYLIFPCLYLAIWPGRTATVRLAYGALGIALLVMVGPQIAGRFVVWLFGVGIAILKPNRWMASRWFFAVTPLVFVLVAVAARYRALPGGVPGDLIVGVAFAMWIMALVFGNERNYGRVRAAFSHNLSSMSYTMYLVHLPFLFLAHGWLIGEGSQWKPGGTPYWASLLVLVTCLAYVGLVWFLFESRTDSLRGWLRGRLVAKAVPA